MAANMTAPSQLMELSHPQSHNDASTQMIQNCECFVDDDETTAVVPVGMDMCSRYRL